MLESQPPPIIQWFMIVNDMTSSVTVDGINVQLLEDNRFLYLRGVTTSTIEYYCAVTNARIHETVRGTSFLINGTGLMDGETHVYKEIGNRTALVGELNFMFSYIAANGLVDQACTFHVDDTPVTGLLGIGTRTGTLSTPGVSSLSCRQGSITIVGNPGILTIYGESILYSEWSCVDLPSTQNMLPSPLLPCPTVR